MAVLCMTVSFGYARSTPTRFIHAKSKTSLLIPLSRETAAYSQLHEITRVDTRVPYTASTANLDDIFRDVDTNMDVSPRGGQNTARPAERAKSVGDWVSTRRSKSRKQERPLRSSMRTDCCRKLVFRRLRRA